ncbi:MAG: SpoIIE family protein phosphatase, partial [Methanococcaceae archaeon]
MQKDQIGSYGYISLSGNSSGLGLITKIIFNDSLIWFYSEKTLSRYNAATNKVELRLESDSGSSFTGMFVNHQNTFVNVSGKGLYRIQSDTLFPIITGYLTAKTDILFSLPYDETMVLVGLSDGRLLLFDGLKYYDYQARDDGYLKANILSDGITLGDSLYAFSTFDGGAVIMERKSGRVRFTINNQNGLPDDEIFAIGQDMSGGLWLSHQYGLTRADLNIPVGNFSVYPGLTGNLSSSLRYNNELYVASSEGVFYLTEIKNYSEVDVLKRSNADIKPARTPVKQSPSSVLQEKASETQNRRKGIFNRIFGKKDTVQQEHRPKEPEITVDIIAQTPAYKYTWQKISKLKSINYVYRKVEGLNEKCRQLVPTQNGLLAATNRGVFFINNHKATLIADNRYINFISWQPFDGKYAIVTTEGYFLLKKANNSWKVEVPDPAFRNPLYSVVQADNNTLWLGGEDIAYKTSLNKEVGKVLYEPFRIENNFPQRYFVNLINDSVFIMTETGVNYYDSTTNNFMPYNIALSGSVHEDVFSYPLSNIPLVKYGSEWIFNQKVKPIGEKDVAMLKLFDDILSVQIEKENIWIIDGKNILYRINRNRSSGITPATQLFVKNIQNEKGINFDLSNVIFERGDNVINFKIIAPGFLKNNLTQYQYYIPKLMPGWSTWSTQASYSRGIPRSGEYILLVRAKDLWGNIGEPVSLSFTIRTAFTRSTFFYVLLIIAVSILVFLIVRFRESQLKEKNRILEEKVRERTAEIEAQKEEITSSIEYASRIQMAMLPVNDLFKVLFSDSFIIFKPRDIVSGDFYWIGEDEKNIYVAVADCTGHGVPGAFMSALGISTLNEIITNNKDLQANKVLNLLREKIKGSLHQTGKEGEAADGMDISFIIIRKYRKKIQFAGAYNSLLIYSGGELIEYKADRMPIGIHYRNEASFTNYDINIKKGDAIYILTDGLPDQFGGP